METATDVSNIPVGSSSLRHVLVVGGTLHDWSVLSSEAWDRRVESLGELCGALGVPWLTLRAYEPGSEPGGESLRPWRRSVGDCEVIVDPCGDGRQRFADAMRRLDDGDEVNEATVAAVLYDPADCEPDLVVVLVVAKFVVVLDLLGNLVSKGGVGHAGSGGPRVGWNELKYSCFDWAWCQTTEWDAHFVSNVGNRILARLICLQSNNQLCGASFKIRFQFALSSISIERDTGRPIGNRQDCHG